MAYSLKLFGLNILESKRTLENPSVSLQDPAAIDALFGIDSSSVDVSHDTAIIYSAVWRAVSLLSGTIASLPLHVYKINSDGSREIIDDHPIRVLLARKPNDKYDAYIFRERIMAFLLLWGNSYAIIERDKYYRPSTLRLIHPNDIEVSETETKIFYKYKNVTYPSTDFLHFRGFGDGIMGKDPITIARESLKGGLIYQKTANMMFEKGYMNDRYITMPGFIPDQKRKTFIESLQQGYYGMDNQGKIMVLEGGTELKAIGMNPENLQFLESRKHHISEVARWFGVPLHKLADLDRSTNNNIEHQAIEFVTDTLLLWTVRIEQEINNKLFTEAEAPNHYVKLNLSGLLRGDQASRAAYYQKATGGVGWMSPDEVRKLEEFNQRGGQADELYFPLNMSNNPGLVTKNEK